MIAALLAATLILQIFGLFAAVVLLPRWIERQKRALWDSLREFVETKDDKTPSPLAILTDDVATVFAGRLWQQVEARLRGSVGAMGREDVKAAEGEVAASGPLAALAMAFLPKRAKMMLIKNPQFLGALSNLLPGNHKASSGSDGQKPSNFKMEM
jgi:hypothetical protein